MSTINLHMDYYSPGELKSYSKSPKANAYLNALHWTDDVLGRFLELLKKRGLLDDSLIILQGCVVCSRPSDRV